MSRAYKIRVSETLRRIIRAEDHVRSHLEVLEILPSDEMAELLARELEEQGFERKGDVAERRDGEITVTIALATGEVTVKAETSKEVEVRGERKGTAFEEDGPERDQAEQSLRQRLKKDLEEDLGKQSTNLEKKVTDRLEAELGDIRRLLDRAVNRATAEALKQKAARIGQIKEMSDDPQSGSLTIVVEV